MCNVCYGMNWVIGEGDGKLYPCPGCNPAFEEMRRAKLAALVPMNQEGRGSYEKDDETRYANDTEHTDSETASGGRVDEEGWRWFWAIQLEAGTPAP